ncbi:MAG: MBL fold metallo-hydrolase, partial [Pseudohongiellaceae bacterium]
SVTMYPEFSGALTGTARAEAAAPAALAPLAAAEGLQSLQVRDRIWLITGAGANITAQVGDEGVLLVDSGSAANAEAVRAEIRRIAGNKPVRYIINTNWQESHTGGNVLLSDEGQRAAILAHENVGLRLAEADSPASALVMDTYYGDNKTLYFNGEAIEIIKVPNAHTDGDSLVFFRGSDVVVAGGVIDTASFPRIDDEQGGSIGGELAALNRILDITVAETRGQGGTLVIPGHGRLYDEADVAEYRDMVTIVRDRVQSALDSRTSLADLQAGQPVLDYAGVFGAAGSDWTGERFVEAVFEQLANAE